MTKQEQPTEVAVILDRSGSMGVVADETVKGFNKFVKEQPPGTLISLSQFDAVSGEPTVQDVFEQKPAKEATIRSADYRPRGMTPLMDAVGSVVSRLRDRKPKGKVVVLIVTDGLENASREWSRERVRELIAKMRKKGWQFVFMGADIDAYAESADLGMAAGSTYGYANSVIGTRAAWGHVSTATRSYVSGASGAVDMPDHDTSQDDPVTSL